MARPIRITTCAYNQSTIPPFTRKFYLVFPQNLTAWIANYFPQNQAFFRLFRSTNADVSSRLHAGRLVSSNRSQRAPHMRAIQPRTAHAGRHTVSRLVPAATLPPHRERSRQLAGSHRTSSPLRAPPSAPAGQHPSAPRSATIAPRRLLAHHSQSAMTPNTKTPARARPAQSSCVGFYVFGSKPVQIGCFKPNRPFRAVSSIMRAAATSPAGTIYNARHARRHAVTPPEDRRQVHAAIVTVTAIYMRAVAFRRPGQSARALTAFHHLLDPHRRTSRSRRPRRERRGTPARLPPARPRITVPPAHSHGRDTPHTADSHALHTHQRHVKGKNHTTKQNDRHTLYHQ